MKKFLFLGLVGVLLVGAVCWLGCGGDEDGDDIVGDWEYYSRIYPDGSILYYEENQNEKGFVSFKSSGTMVEIGFYRVGNFWIESRGEIWRWRVSGSTIYMSDKANGVYDESAQYRISGNKLIIMACSNGRDDRCDESTFTKANVTDVRKNLGRVYTMNPALDGLWVLQGSRYERISFYGSWFVGGNRYINAEFDDGYCYTDGSKLVLIDDEDLTLRVTLTYSVSGSGSNKTLKINNDTWKLDEDYYYSPAKSKQPNPAHSGVFDGGR